MKIEGGVEVVVINGGEKEVKIGVREKTYHKNLLIISVSTTNHNGSAATKLQLNCVMLQTVPRLNV